MILAPFKKAPSIIFGMASWRSATTTRIGIVGGVDPQRHRGGADAEVRGSESLKCPVSRWIACIFRNGAAQRAGFMAFGNRVFVER